MDENIAATALLEPFNVLLINQTIGHFTAPQISDFYKKVIEPRKSLLISVIALGLLDIAAWLFFRVFLEVSWYSSLETLLTLALTLSCGWLMSRLFKEYFGSYVLSAAAKQGQKANGELLILGKFFANFGIVVGFAILFGQTHNFNVFGLVASLGVGGIAIAFAAQKVLEQLLGGIVIYVDRPFNIDDYIGLPDGTYGRVEAIGLRSTKVRTSGKGTLAIVPNNAIIQSTVENFTGAKKVMALLYLNFRKKISADEQALIRQVIVDATQDVSGLDNRGTDIAFRKDTESGHTQAQATFFILGSSDDSMRIRRQLLDIANQNLTYRLQEYGIDFDIKAPTIYVDSPIAV
ncbi:mechanosensitive ion channel [Leptolyngbya cf. ectocarpi LEGE 11479]|uniref:Mechanosensitive ion channel n=1 Tax=Leptolyngbya cf. ectocarpi LEGE 11479 TaxID=1828722 RepID=A0A929FCG2_LEPEC|nr:mechanosensitive ion channel domain-containing protein [Leptolyngbya ectocarpi]MBE9069969.1 mechanosensitive ion channel [Leptolyngbya cf. ectocarpi LEGE 11479]